MIKKIKYIVSEKTGEIIYVKNDELNYLEDKEFIYFNDIINEFIFDFDKIRINDISLYFYNKYYLYKTINLKTFNDKYKINDIFIYRGGRINNYDYTLVFNKGDILFELINKDNKKLLYNKFQMLNIFNNGDIKEDKKLSPEIINILNILEKDNIVYLKIKKNSLSCKDNFKLLLDNLKYQLFSEKEKYFISYKWYEKEDFFIKIKVNANGNYSTIHFYNFFDSKYINLC